MNDFWINIKKPGMFYVVEQWWTVGDDRILYVEKRKRLTKWGAKRYARRCIIANVCNGYIKEKYDE
jgi:hypothetical protein